jgi:hypothetical protein
MTRYAEFDAQDNLIRVYYQNSDNAAVATFDPEDTSHNHGLTWHWENLTVTEKDLVLHWIFDPQHMPYTNLENRESWVVNAIVRWIPKITELSAPTDPRIWAQRQTDGPPMNQMTRYEALSRFKSLALVRERRMCSYGYSHLGLIEYGGEIVLFAAPGWQQVSAKTREILTAVWTIKEAMVIYYPQSLGWADSCPSESEHLENEYYSTIWLLKAEQTLSRSVPADASYWIGQEIPLSPEYTDSHIPKVPFPARLPVPPTTAVSEGCTQIQ